MYPGANTPASNTFAQRPFPIQKDTKLEVSDKVIEMAHEVYDAVFQTSQSLGRIRERGGFSAVEIMVLLYAHNFNKNEWRDRVHEAMYRGTHDIMVPVFKIKK